MPKNAKKRTSKSKEKSFKNQKKKVIDEKQIQELLTPLFDDNVKTREPKKYNYKGKKYTAFELDILRSRILNDELNKMDNEKVNLEQMMNTIGPPTQDDRYYETYNRAKQHLTNKEPEKKKYSFSKITGLVKPHVRFKGGKKERKRPNGIKTSQSQPPPQPPPPQLNQRRLQLLEDLVRANRILNHPNFNTLSEEDRTSFQAAYDQNIQELIQEGVTHQQIDTFLQMFQQEQQELQQLQQEDQQGGRRKKKTRKKTRKKTAGCWPFCKRSNRIHGIHSRENEPTSLSTYIDFLKNKHTDLYRKIKDEENNIKVLKGEIQRAYENGFDQESRIWNSPYAEGNYDTLINKYNDSINNLNDYHKNGRILFNANPIGNVVEYQGYDDLPYAKTTDKKITISSKNIKSKKPPLRAAIRDFIDHRKVVPVVTGNSKIGGRRKKRIHKNKTKKNRKRNRSTHKRKNKK